LEYINKIKLESEMYNNFRNKLRYLLNKYENKEKREEIENVSNSKYIVYSIQIKLLNEMLKNIMKDEVEFVELTPELEKRMKKSVNTDEVLMVPNTNQINGLSNEKIYYGKLSDELIRYNRIKEFIFDPKMFLSFTDVKYNLRENEIILLQSLLTQDYFDDLIPETQSKYITNKTYDTVDPNISQRYSNLYEDKIEKIETAEKIDIKKIFEIVGECEYEIKKVYGKWEFNIKGL